MQLENYFPSQVGSKLYLLTYFLLAAMVHMNLKCLEPSGKERFSSTGNNIDY